MSVEEPHNLLVYLWLCMSTYE